MNLTLKNKKNLFAPLLYKTLKWLSNHEYYNEATDDEDINVKCVSIVPETMYLVSNRNLKYIISSSLRLNNSNGVKKCYFKCFQCLHHCCTFKTV